MIGLAIAFFLARLLIIRFNWRSRPVSEFEMRHVLEGVTGWIPGWKKPNSNAMEITDDVSDYELQEPK